jgi:hypothetical protein
MSKARYMARIINSSGQVETSVLQNVIDAAPEALDTLNELAAALNDNANITSVLEDNATASAIALG